MQSSFNQLSKEKQLRIINAALEVFSKNDYKHANTEEIAKLADISKGSLFYYFKNKKELYYFIFKYSISVITKDVMDDHYKEITDFYELIEYASNKKYTLLDKHPYFLDFTLRSLHETDSEIQKFVNKEIDKSTTLSEINYFESVDFEKFKEDINPQQIYKMMSWMAIGYLNEQRFLSPTLDVDKLKKESQSWYKFFKEISYKEEYK